MTENPIDEYRVAREHRDTAAAAGQVPAEAVGIAETAYFEALDDDLAPNDAFRAAFAAATPLIAAAQQEEIDLLREWPPDWWWHEAHGLHDEAHHQHHRPLDICVPLNSARPPGRPPGGPR